MHLGGGCIEGRGQAWSGRDLALLGLQVDRGSPPLPPAAEECGEGGVHLRLVGVQHGEVRGEVRGGQGGGEAAPTGPILALVGDLKQPHGRFQDGEALLVTAAAGCWPVHDIRMNKQYLRIKLLSVPIKYTKQVFNY